GRYSGQDDLVVGTPVANRTHAATEGLIVCFINTLALRADLAANPPGTELLRQVRETALGAYAHQDLPFERLIDELELPRDLSRTPLAQAALALQNPPSPAVALSGLSLEVLSTPTATAKFDLTLTVTETPQGLAGSVEYSTDLFEAATIGRLVGHFRTLL